MNFVEQLPFDVILYHILPKCGDKVKLQLCTTNRALEKEKPYIKFTGFYGLPKTNHSSKIIKGITLDQKSSEEFPYPENIISLIMIGHDDLFRYKNLKTVFVVSRVDNIYIPPWVENIKIERDILSATSVFLKGKNVKKLSVLSPVTIHSSSPVSVDVLVKKSKIENEDILKPLSVLCS